jgi:hypothetical protein
MHPNTNGCSLVNSQLGAGRERGRGPVDHHRLCRVAGADRGDYFLPAHACVGGATRAAGLGRRPHPVASLTANVAVAEPAATGRVIARGRRSRL